MSTIFLIQAKFTAIGGQGGCTDVNVCAAPYNKDVRKLLKKLKCWVDEIHDIELPDDFDVDPESERERELYDEMLYEFQTQALIDMKVPESLHSFFIESWNVFTCSICTFAAEELEFIDD